MRSVKHTRSILALCMTFATLVGLAGCSFLWPPDPPPGPIVGIWQFNIPPNSFTMTLTSGMTFIVAYVQGVTSHTSSGTYTNDASSIVFTTTVFDNVTIPAQVDIADYSLSPNGSSMVLTYRSGTPPVLILARI